MAFERGVRDEVGAKFAAFQRSRCFADVGVSPKHVSIPISWHSMLEILVSGAPLLALYWS